MLKTQNLIHGMELYHKLDPVYHELYQAIVSQNRWGSVIGFVLSTHAYAHLYHELYHAYAHLYHELYHAYAHLYHAKDPNYHAKDPSVS
jgi:hypothetical protein